ncbi:glycoside hydrolase family 13 protein [Haloarchaeobius sp. TZWWS8]|uniref:glycoside hydrolase family 13 protein n=1 Tax=Haloarchaeobius sp. TZWWS8 TaxID=3446121 RepID=UPI003EB6F89D
MTGSESQPAAAQLSNDDIDRAWWKEAIVYQIYPRSFNDSDGDGVGDIQGIIDRVDYLDTLGVDVVWLCPVYASPNADNGYDISDYRSIQDEFGTMADWEELLAVLHERDIRLIMDLVVNHTSDEHEWFQCSRRREDGYEKYYHWVEGSPDEPPNNWQSIFGGSAWAYDDEREAWYLHVFDEKQPDLNWANPAVRAEVKELMRWWLEKGIDGFRMDAINHIVKTDGYPDGDPDAEPVGIDHFKHVPPIRDYFGELHDDVLSEYDVMIAGEMGGTSIADVASYLERGDSPLDMAFQFTHLSIFEEPDEWGADSTASWDLVDLKEIVTRCQNELTGEWWDAVFMGNHDVPRLVSRFGDDDAHRTKSATLIATFLLTLRGTPYIYQGEEIGMTNQTFDSLDEIDDPQTLGHVEALRDAGRIESTDAALNYANTTSRDHARTPMQWTDEPNGGFTDGSPWLAVNENTADINVEKAVAADDSVWNHYRQLIELRHETDVLVYGDYDLLLPDDPQFYAYTRTLGDEAILVVLNWSGERATFDCPTVETAGSTLIWRNYDDTPGDPNGASFRPYEAAIYRV